MSKEETIRVPFPVNADEEVLQLLRKKETYSVRFPKIRKLKNVFVTYDGIVMKNGRLVDGCAFNLKGKEDNTFYYHFWRDTFEKYLVCKWGKSIPSVQLKGDQKYLLIHSKWFNYAFWINSFLPRLIQAEQEGYLNNTKLLVPEGWEKIPFVSDSLQLFEVEKEIIPMDHHLFVKHLIMPETRKWTASFVPETIQFTRQRLIDEAIKRTDSSMVRPAKIYLTRSKRGLRGVENEEAVVDLLKEYGYSVVTFEDLSIWEQIMTMYHATHFISIHGAGLANLMFMEPGSNVLELINKPYAKLEYTFPFWKLGNSVHLNYFMQLCDTLNDEQLILGFGKDATKNDSDYLVNKNLEVDISTLLNNLKRME